MAGDAEDELLCCSRPFRPAHRLHVPKEFAAVMASPLRLRGGCFELRYLRRADCLPGNARLGLVIPKRLARRAVLRNQIKRLAREAFRQALPALPGVDAVLRLTRAPLAPAVKVDGELRRAWRGEIDKLLAGLAR